MELKKELLKLLVEDREFRNEIYNILNIDDLEFRIEQIEKKNT